MEPVRHDRVAPAADAVDEVAVCGCLSASGVTAVGLVADDAICALCPDIATVGWELTLLELGRGAEED